MTTPASPNAISLNDVQTEFGGTNPIEIAEYYAGGSFVPATVSGVPTSGTISLDDLRGKTKIIYAISLSISPSSGIYPYTSTITWTSNLPVGGYVNIIITYPNGLVNDLLTNQPINGTAQSAWGGTVGLGNGSIYATGYSSAGTLLATSNTVTYSIYAPAVINNVYFSPSSITAGVTPFALYWSVSNASRVEYTIILPSGGTITDTVTNLNSNSGQFITYTAGTLFGEIVAFGINGGTVSRSIRVTVAAQPTYSLTSNKSAVNEGDNFTITFSTNQPGSFPYTISGVSTQDIGDASMSGSLSNGDQITFTATADNTTDLANPETFTLSLNNGLASASVSIYDTSQTPAYSLTSNKSAVNEGDNFTITFTTNQPGSFPYTISGVSTEDIGQASMSGSLSNGDQITFTATADNLTDPAGTETFTLSLNNGLASASVNIYDTSQTPFFTLTRSAASVDEGAGFYIDFSTNQPGLHPYTITGVSSQDIGGAPLSGSISNGDRLSYTVTADNTTEGREVFNIFCRSASATVFINDTSQTPSYRFTRSAPGVNEGSTFYVDFSTNQSGSFPYTISGVSSADIGGAPLSGSISNGDRLSYTATADNSTEGTEYFTITSMGASISVFINDTSRDPAYYIFTRSTSAVNEGTSFYIDFSTNQPGSFPYAISGVSTEDIGGVSIYGSVSNGDRLNFTATADNTTDASYTETFTIALNNGQASTTVDIYDTSQTPYYTLTRSTGSVNEDSSFYIDFNTNQPGSFGYSISGVDSNDIGGAPLSGFINNGSRLTYNVTADRYTEGTEYFTISAAGTSTTVTINDTSQTPSCTTYYDDVLITGSTGGAVYGSNPYTDDSSLAAAAVHAGLLSVGQTGVIRRTNAGYRYDYYGSYQNGVSSFTYTAGWCGFTLSLVSITPSFNSYSASPTSTYNTNNVSISWSTTNTNYVNISINNPYGNNVVNQNLGNNSSYTYNGSSGNVIGTYTVTLTAYSVTGHTASATVYFTLTQEPIYPSFNSYSLSSSNTFNTNNVTANWSTLNATSVDVQVTFPSGTVNTSNNLSANASGFVLFYGSSSNQIGQYTVALTARSSTNNTTTVYLNFTYTAPPTFSATYNSFSSSDGQSSGPNTFFDQANSRITIRGYSASLIPNNDGRDSSTPYLDDTVPAYWNGQIKWGQATYTTTGDGYIWLYPIVSSEFTYDIATVQLDGTTILLDAPYSSISGPSGNSRTYQWYFSYLGTYPNVTVNWRYSSPYPIKIAVSAGTHTIRLNYQKDAYLALGYDEAQLAWLWSAT